MPVRSCKAPLCPALLTGRSWCDEHAHLAPKQDRTEYFRTYDQHQRNADAKAFYNSPEWERARLKKLATNPVCEECERVFANTVHHKKPLAECTPAERVAQDNLQSVCPPCHGKIEAAAKLAKAVA